MHGSDVNMELGEISLKDLPNFLRKEQIRRNKEFLTVQVQEKYRKIDEKYPGGLFMAPLNLKSKHIEPKQSEFYETKIAPAILNGSTKIQKGGPQMVDIQPFINSVQNLAKNVIAYNRTYICIWYLRIVPTKYMAITKMFQLPIKHTDQKGLFPMYGSYMEHIENKSNENSNNTGFLKNPDISLQCLDNEEKICELQEINIRNICGIEQTWYNSHIKAEYVRLEKLLQQMLAGDHRTKPLSNWQKNKIVYIYNKFNQDILNQSNKFYDVQIKKKFSPLDLFPKRRDKSVKSEQFFSQKKKNSSKKNQNGSAKKNSGKKKQKEYWLKQKTKKQGKPKPKNFPSQPKAKNYNGNFLRTKKKNKGPQNQNQNQNRGRNFQRDNFQQGYGASPDPRYGRYAMNRSKSKGKNKNAYNQNPNRGNSNRGQRGLNSHRGARGVNRGSRGRSPMRKF